jgi:putative glutamine amidotransferase
LDYLNIELRMTYRPNIGLTMRLEVETRRFYLGRDYSEALEACRALPVHIPLVPRREYIDELVRGFDGILLPGSDTDVDPAYYGEDPHPLLGKVITEKDETELLVLEAAERLGMPILAICYGMQALNVSRGGTLFQDITTQLGNSVKHQQGIPLARASHFVEIQAESLLGTVGTGAKVNSHHHQAIAQPGKGLEVIARARDGVIEAVQDTRDNRFVLGVQWHPELSWNNDRLSSAIFSNFVEAAVKFAECRNLLLAA